MANKDLFIRNFTDKYSVINGQIASVAISVRVKLCEAANYYFGKSGFPKIAFFSRSDLVKCYGIIVPKVFGSIDLSNDKLFKKKLLILNQNGLFVFNTRDNIPIINDFLPASDLQYILFGESAMKELTAVGEKSVECGS